MKQRAWQSLARRGLGAGSLTHKTNWHRQRETQTRYRHGNREQVETIRVGKAIRLVGRTQGEVASYLKREERRSFKIRQQTIEQYTRHPSTASFLGHDSTPPSSDGTWRTRHLRVTVVEWGQDPQWSLQDPGMFLGAITLLVHQELWNCPCCAQQEVS